MNDQILIDYSPPSWPEWVRFILTESIELILRISARLAPWPLAMSTNRRSGRCTG